jgi:hypothetical protein
LFSVPGFKRRFLFPAPAVLLAGILLAIPSGSSAQTDGVSPRVIEKLEPAPTPWRLTIEPALQYTLTSRERLSVSGFTLFEAIHIGRISASRLQRTLIIPSLTLRATLKSLEIWGRVPWLFREDREDVPVEDQTRSLSFNSNNLGDIEGGLSFRLFRESKSWPDFYLTARFKSRTGMDPYGLSSVAVPNVGQRLTTFPSGSGHYGIAEGISIIRSSDPAVYFFNLEYFHNIPRNVGVQAGSDFSYINPGDSVEYGFGLAFALNERLSTSLSYKQRITQKTEQNLVPLVGTNVNVATLNFGWTLVSGKRSVNINVGIGLTEDASDVDLLLRMPFSIYF